MNILSRFQNFIYFQVDTNLLFLYTHLPTNTHPPLRQTNARLGSIKNILNAAGSNPLLLIINELLPND